MGSYIPTNEERKAEMWCFYNKIIITPRQVKAGVKMWYIDIETGIYPNIKKLGTSPESYGPSDILKKVFEYKLYYYNKHKKDATDIL